MRDETRTSQHSLSPSGFPSDFAWGAATAAYQIEGAPRADGKGESIWDRFTHTPGHVVDGSTGDVACDSYSRWQEDLDLLAELQLKAYRFSLSWPRVLPEGRGKPNQRGLDYYDRLVDGLLERGVEPFVTLYHWDLPQALQDAGGWANRATAEAFAEFTTAAARRLGDRVRHWITLNEPHVVVYLGHVTGEHAPGLKDRSLIAPVSHHLLLAHGRAVQSLRAETPPATQVGATLNLAALEPASDKSEDVEATERMDGLFHRWYLDPLMRGTYPDDIRAVLNIPDNLIAENDLATIATPTDFLGVNYYTRLRIRAGTAEPVILPPQGPLTTMGWEVAPDGLTEVLVRVARDHAPARMYVTENGAAYPDTLAGDGQVHDTQRTEYLRAHFVAVREALAQGVPLAGYFVWSLLDNFEWGYGYTQRFGVSYTDYETQRRIRKDSARFLADIAATNGINLS